jgi:hypothetical protein
VSEVSAVLAGNASGKSDFFHDFNHRGSLQHASTHGKNGIDGNAAHSVNCGC